VRGVGLRARVSSVWFVSVIVISEVWVCAVSVVSVALGSLHCSGGGGGLWGSGEEEMYGANGKSRACRDNGGSGATEAWGDGGGDIGSGPGILWLLIN
jgi:hypothetical protein